MFFKRIGKGSRVRTREPLPQTLVCLSGLLSLFLGYLAARAVDLGEARFLSQTRQLTFEGQRSGEGYFSPDGKMLIFQSEREPGNPFYQIYTMDLESGDIRRVSPGIGKTTCSFFRPGSDEVLFASNPSRPGRACQAKG
jgi:hypothetical protein